MDVRDIIIFVHYQHFDWIIKQYQTGLLLNGYANKQTCRDKSYLGTKPLIISVSKQGPKFTLKKIDWGGGGGGAETTSFDILLHWLRTLCVLVTVYISIYNFKWWPPVWDTGLKVTKFDQSMS